jgi:predicted RNA-binding protein with PUA-like domain
MRHWLFKEEPTHYDWAHLVADGRTWWDGVENALARKHLRSVSPGDRVFLYHTGKEKAVVGTMTVVAGPALPPGASDECEATVEVSPNRALPRPVTLAEIKADAELAGWDLVRLPRLSVVPVTESQWRRVISLAEADG